MNTQLLRVRGAILGVTLAAWIMLGLTIVLASTHPNWSETKSGEIEGTWWTYLALMASAWIVLGWLFRWARANLGLVGAIIGAAILAPFFGIHSSIGVTLLALVFFLGNRSETVQERSEPKSAITTLAGPEKRAYGQSCAIAGLLVLVACGIWWANSPHDEWVPPEARQPLVNAPAVEEPTPEPTPWPTLPEAAELQRPGDVAFRAEPVQPGPEQYDEHYVPPPLPKHRHHRAQN